MASTKRVVSVAALALLALVCHAANRSNAEDGRTTTHAITTNSINANGTIPRLFRTSTATGRSALATF